jgi:hypothetical protein
LKSIDNSSGGTDDIAENGCALRDRKPEPGCQTRTPTRYLMGTPNVPNSFAVNRQEGGTIALTQLPWEEIVLGTGESRRYSIDVP